MSSFKNASKNSKPHRERKQPQAREHLGLLEKKKDYILRAKDSNAKKRQLKELRQKALNRNPDEFYFHMINSKTDEEGVHREKDKEEDTKEQVMLMQTQDLRYVDMKLVMEKRKVDKLQSNLHLLATQRVPNKHTFFVDSKAEAASLDVAERLDTHPALLGRKHNRLTKVQLAKISINNKDPETVKKVSNEMRKSYLELEKRIRRENELMIVHQKLQVKRQLMNKKNPPAEKVKPGTKHAPPVYKWKMERKK